MGEEENNKGLRKIGKGIIPISDVPGYPINVIPDVRSVLRGWMSVDIQPKMVHTQC